MLQGRPLGVTSNNNLTESEDAEYSNSIGTEEMKLHSLSATAEVPLTLPMIAATPIPLVEQSREVGEDAGSKGKKNGTINSVATTFCVASLSSYMCLANNLLRPSQNIRC